MRGNILQTIIIFMAVAIVLYGVLTAMYNEVIVDVSFDDAASEYELVGELTASKKEDLSKPLTFKGVIRETGKLRCGVSLWSFGLPDEIYVETPRAMKVVGIENVSTDFQTGMVKNAQGADWLTIDNIEQMPSSTNMTFTVLNDELPYTAQLYVDDELRAECGAEYTIEEDGTVKTGVYVFESWPQMDRHVYVIFKNKLVDVDPSEMSYSAEGTTIIEVK